MKLIVMCALLGYAFGKTSDSVYKRKMCIRYEMKDHISTSAVLNRRYYSSKMQCMASCAHHFSCNTYHFRSIDGTCELLKVSEKCLSWNISKDTTLTRLDECEKTTPWKVISPAEGKLQWVEPHGVGSRLIITVSKREKGRQVARALHEGTYLPGFVIGNRFFAATMDGKIIQCSESFQVLTHARPGAYVWVSFIVGDKVLQSAVVGGYWRDETPLYIIYLQTDLDWKPGFYNAVTERIYVKLKRTVLQRWPLRMLLEN